MAKKYVSVSELRKLLGIPSDGQCTGCQFSALYGCKDDSIQRACEAIDDAPEADVRPVVLCRDCKHFNPYPGDCTDGGIEGVCKRHNSIGVLVMDEDFCSDAERI